MQWQRQFLGGLQLALLPTQACEGELLEGGGAKGEVGVDLLHLEDQYHIPPRPIKTLVLTPTWWALLQLPHGHPRKRH